MSDYLSTAVVIAREAGALLAELFTTELEITSRWEKPPVPKSKCSPVFRKASASWGIPATST